MKSRESLSEEESVILEELLNRYERSKWFREGHSNQRVMMRAGRVAGDDGEGHQYPPVRRQQAF